MGSTLTLAQRSATAILVNGKADRYLRRCRFLRHRLTQGLKFMEMIKRPSAGDNLGDRILKVNHAGEHWAISIYSGQMFMASFTVPGLVDEFKESRSHERWHRSIFGAELLRNRPRCHSYWLCGLVLGLVTILFFDVALSQPQLLRLRVSYFRHLEQQLVALQGNDPAAVAAISAIVAEQKQHHDHSASHVQAGTFWPRLLSPIVSASTEAVVWLGMRL